MCRVEVGYQGKQEKQRKHEQKDSGAFPHDIYLPRDFGRGFLEHSFSWLVIYLS